MQERLMPALRRSVGAASVRTAARSRRVACTGLRHERTFAGHGSPVRRACTGAGAITSRSSRSSIRQGFAGFADGLSSSVVLVVGGDVADAGVQPDGVVVLANDAEPLSAY